MTLSPPVRTAVLEVVRRLRDPECVCHVDNVGFMLLDAMPNPYPRSRHAALESLRLALGLDTIPGSLARWARGKSREEIAKALDRVATSPSDER
jgi:hypothetical protein